MWGLHFLATQWYGQICTLFVLISFLGIMTNENNTICDNFLQDKTVKFFPLIFYRFCAVCDECLKWMIW